jgi:multisubunit Na+/H+ antiporter MnhG subunit
MYLFNRTRVAHPAHASAALSFAAEIAVKASSVSGTEINAWSSVMSPNAGAIAWTAWFENLADWEVAAEKLGADPGYNHMVEMSDSYFTGPVIDGMASIVSPMPDVNERAEYVTIVSTVAANGHIAAAVDHGLKIATTASRIEGLTTLFAMDVTGPYGGVAWMTGAPNIAAMDKSLAAINSSAEFAKLVDSGGNLYQGQATQITYRRLI